MPLLVARLGLTALMPVAWPTPLGGLTPKLYKIAHPGGFCRLSAHFEHFSALAVQS
jgi:hypothetical protein